MKEGVEIFDPFDGPIKDNAGIPQRVKAGGAGVQGRPVEHHVLC